jgi:hypothetical protein
MSSSATATASASGGTSLGGLLTVLFVALKLTGVIAWSWWWVLSPLWISAALVVVLVAVVLVVAVIASK